ncbi:hypothetical protein GTY54_09230, partial [Streptomyces sp. SID625]|nr:hypothetical protein [Streptomyces sp. SID625]
MSTRTSTVSAADFTVVVAAPEGDAEPALRSVARQSPPPAAVVLITGGGPEPGRGEV